MAEDTEDDLSPEPDEIEPDDELDADPEPEADDPEIDPDPDKANPDPDADPAPEERPRRGGGSDTIRRLRARAQVAEREQRELRDRLERLEGRGNDRPDPDRRAREEAEEAARVANMTVEERVAYYRQKDRQEYGRGLLEIERRGQAREDKRDFERMLDRNPKLARHADEVERRFKAAFDAGNFASRQDIIRWLIGEAALKGGGKAADQQRRQAADRRQRQEARAPGGGSDRPRSQARRPKSAKERLEGVTF